MSTVQAEIRPWPWAITSYMPLIFRRPCINVPSDGRGDSAGHRSGRTSRLLSGVRRLPDPDWETALRLHLRHRPDGLRGHVLPAEPDVHAGRQHARDGVGARLLSAALPMVVLSGVSIVLSLQGALGMALAGLTILWCSLSASKLFVTALAMDHRRPLVCYPCALLYGVFALLTIPGWWRGRSHLLIF